MRRSHMRLNRLDVAMRPACLIPNYKKFIVINFMMLMFNLHGGLFELKKIGNGLGDVSCNGSAKGLTDLTMLSTIGSTGDIVKLDLSSNHITDFNMKELSHAMPHLRHINISGNQIIKLRRRMLEGVPCHTLFDLSNNPIKTTSKKILSLMSKLADKDVTISLYATQLPEDLLQKMESRIENLSSSHTWYNVGVVMLGGIIFVGSIPLKALSDSLGPELSSLSSDGLSSGALSSQGSVLQCSPYQPYLKGLSICMFVAGAALMAVQPCLHYLQHDIKQSKLYWHILV